MSELHPERLRADGLADDPLGVQRKRLPLFAPSEMTTDSYLQKIESPRSHRFVTYESHEPYLCTLRAHMKMPE